ncbi:MAG TPA: NAD(P)/FAD-dependent oxidoreductase [Crocinitomix sp.]|nr:NAD(P)/FAD-dependent oxidoreductase [Crocinitomix sp.]
MEKIVIIGNGISGVTCARHIRKNSNKEILIISGETEYFFSRTALMYVFMGHMRFEDIKPYEDWFWKKNKIDLMFDFVEAIDTDTNTLTLKSGQTVNYDKLVLAVGSKPNKFGWKGQDLKGVTGLYAYQDLQEIERYADNTNNAVIVGGGLIGVEFAEMMLSRGISVTFLVRESKFWGNVLPEEDAKLIANHIKSHHVNLKFNTELDEIIDDGQGKVKGVKTNTGEIIDCEIVGLTAGVSPNITFIKSSKIEVDRGVKVNRYFETNIKGVYAIGDCAQLDENINGRRSIEQVWYTGRIMGETLAQTICGNPLKYNPGPWFNSAKFFDIEYQTYGWVSANPNPNEKRFYWKHSDSLKAMHFVWDKHTDEFIGVNTFGIRLRHELFDKWLKEKASISTVMSNLNIANFDPELFKHYEVDIIQQFNHKTGKNIVLSHKKWWQKLIQF